MTPTSWKMNNRALLSAMGILCIFLVGVINNFANAADTNLKDGGISVLFYYRHNHIPYDTETTKAFLPYVGYLEKDGTISDWLFDSTILIDLQAGSHSKSKWLRYLDSTFKESGQNDTYPCQFGGECNLYIESSARDTAEVSQLLQLNQPSTGAVSGPAKLPKQNIINFSAIIERSGEELVANKDNFIVGFRFKDNRGKGLQESDSISSLNGKFRYSNWLDAWYQYVKPDSKAFHAKLVAPPMAEAVEVFFRNNTTSGNSNTLIIRDASFSSNGNSTNLLKSKAWKISGFKLFSDGVSPIEGLNSAAKLVGNTINDKAKRHGVILTIPWKNANSDMFGKIGDRNIKLTNNDDIIFAVKWFVDESISRWTGLNQSAKDHLYLKGFYWLEESEPGFLKREEQVLLFQTISAYIRSKGLSLYLSPYNRGYIRPSYDKQIFQYFDGVWLQPNAWPAPIDDKPLWLNRYVAEHLCKPSSLDELQRSGIPICEISENAELAGRMPGNVSINLEWKFSARLERPRFYDYLEMVSGTQNLGGRSFVVYEDGGLVYKAAYSPDEYYRSQYVRLHDFIRGFVNLRTNSSN